MGKSILYSIFAVNLDAIKIRSKKISGLDLLLTTYS
jgi:hypothetical protein